MAALGPGGEKKTIERASCRGEGCFKISGEMTARERNRKAGSCRLRGKQKGRVGGSAILLKFGLEGEKGGGNGREKGARIILKIVTSGMIFGLKNVVRRFFFMRSTPGRKNGCVK